MIVVDASLVGAMLLPDERDEVAEALWVRLDGAIVAPMHFAVEIASLCLKALRRGRLPHAELPAALAAIDVVTGRTRYLSVPAAAVVDLARRHGLSAYDAAYLWVALDRKVPLLTTDGPLGRVAQKLGIAA